MKMFKYLSYALTSFLAMSALLLTSCEEDGDGMHIESPDGKPVIRYIRVPNPTSADSLLIGAQLGSTIAIMGENLGGIREIWFNDRQANLNPSWVTNSSLLVVIPRQAPLNIEDKLYLIDSESDTLVHDFEVVIPPPVLASAKNEWVQDGENLVINGDYLFEPLTISFTGGGEAEIVSITQNRLEVTVPKEAEEGPVTVTTNFGTATSSFYLWDSRNIVLNFDDLVANGWRTGLVEGGEDSLDGNYLVVRGEVAANQRVEGDGASPWEMEYWGGADPERDGNFYPLYPNSYREYALKFEANVKKWYGGYLNICLAEPDHIDSNQEIWSNSHNARAIWGPWAEEGKEFSTDGWVTVVIPLTEFQYYMDYSDEQGVYYTGGQKFIETAAGTLSTWFLGSPENDGNEVEFFMDNFRFVEL